MFIVYSLLDLLTKNKRKAPYQSTVAWRSMHEYSGVPRDARYSTDNDVYREDFTVLPQNAVLLPPRIYLTIN